MAADTRRRRQCPRLESANLLVRALGAFRSAQRHRHLRPQRHPVRSASYGLVLYRGELALGGKVVLVLAPKWRLHYYAHLDSLDAYPGQPVHAGSRLGTVGTSGNARGKPAHLHYAIITLLPYPWLADDSTQGWKKMFYLNPDTVLPSR